MQYKRRRKNSCRIYRRRILVSHS